MSKQSLTFDPVADGRPTPSVLMVGIAVVLIGIGVYRLIQGQFGLGIGDILFGGYVLLSQKLETAAWESGYYAGISSALEQVRGDTNE